MLHLKCRVEELEKSAAECNLLALLIHDSVKSAAIQHIACDRKLAARNSSQLPPYDGSPPFAKAVKPRPMSLSPAVAGLVRSAA